MISAETMARALGLRRVGNTWRGACPLHGGSSFTLADKDGKTLFTCWTGCSREAILRELRQRGLWPVPDWTLAQRRDFARRRQRDEVDLLDARMFADAAAILSEQVLESLDASDPTRASLTRLVATLRTDTGTLAEFRAWRSADPALTKGLVAAGRAHRERLEALLIDYLRQEQPHAV